MKTINKRKVVPGTWIRTFWTDCGAIDGIVILAHEDHFSLFNVGDTYLMNGVGYDQVIQIGEHISAEHSGLNS